MRWTAAETGITAMMIDFHLHAGFDRRLWPCSEFDFDFGFDFGFDFDFER